MTFNGSTSVPEPNHIAVTAVEPASSLTYTLPDIGTNGTFAFLQGTQTFTGAKTFSANTVVTGLLGVGNTSPVAQLDVTRSLSQGATGKALAIFNQTENEDILTASSSGTTEFTIANNGDLTTAGNANINGGSLTTTATSANLFNTNATTLDIGGAATTLNLGAGTGTTTVNNNLAVAANENFTVNAGSGNVNFENTSGITVGQNNNPSSNVAGQIELISAGTNNYATTFTAGNQSANVNYTLPTADGSSNYVLTTNGSGVLSWQSTSGVGAGTIDAVGNITAGAAFTGNDLGNILTFNGSTSVTEPNHIAVTAVEPASSLTYTLPDIGTNGTFAFLQGTQTFTGAKTFSANTVVTGLLGVGNASPVAQLDVTRSLSQGATGKALAIFNQTENEDILTASSSGTTEFTIANNGDLTTAGNANINGGSLTTAATSANLFNTNATTLDIGGAATTLNLGAGTGTTTVNNNLAVAGNSTLTGTLGVTGNTSLTTLSTSGLATLSSASITNSETVGTTLGVTGLATFNGGATITSGQNLNLPGFTPGSITFVNSSNQLAQNNSSLFWDQTNQGLGIGTNSVLPSAGLTVSKQSLGNATVAINQVGLGPIFTASSSGTTRFTIDNAGDLLATGQISGLTGYSQSSGNFAQSGGGTFSTGTGAISLNGNTSVTGANTFTVGTGTTTLGGALGVTGATTLSSTVGVTGLATFNGGATIASGQTLTANGQSTFSPNGSTGVTINTSASNFLTVNGLTTNSGSQLCINSFKRSINV